LYSTANNTNSNTRTGALKFIIRPKTIPTHNNIITANATIDKDAESMNTKSSTSTPTKSFGLGSWIANKFLKSESNNMNNPINRIFHQQIIPLINQNQWESNCLLPISTNVQTKLVLLILHVWFYHTRLRELDYSGSKLLFQSCWNSIQSLYPEQPLQIELQRVAEFIYPILTQFDSIQLSALEKKKLSLQSIRRDKLSSNKSANSTNSAEFEALWLGCIWRNLYNRDKSIDPAQLKQLHYYIQAQLRHIHSLPAKQFLAGQFEFLAPPAKPIIRNNSNVDSVDWSLYERVVSVDLSLLSRYLKFYQFSFLQSNTPELSNLETKNSTDAVDFSSAGRKNFAVPTSNNSNNS